MRHLRLRLIGRVLVLVAVAVGVASSSALAQVRRPTPGCVGLARAEVAARLDQSGWQAEWRSAGPAPGAQQQGRVAFQAPAEAVAAPAGTALILWVYEGESLAAAASDAAATAVAAPVDCSRWPGSVADVASGSCRCAEGLWWAPDGQACVTREQAAALLCARVWSGSVPTWTASGDFRCDCPPESLWDAEALACGGAHADAAGDCSERWPGTTPVFSPGASAYECRCASGARWEESRHRCQAWADPAVLGMMAPPSPSGAQAATSSQPTSTPQAIPLPTPAPQERDAVAAPGGPAAAGAGAGTSDSECADLLAEIGGRARAGQASEADALALRAATRGCDPGAISEAARAGAGTAVAPPAPAAPPPRGLRY